MDAHDVLRWLERRGTRRNVLGMARYGIRSPKVFGVSMATMAPLARRLGKDHALALSLWASGWHDARILAALVDDPSQVSRRQMNDWVRDFDNWAVCDGVCFHLFDRTPFAWEKARQWSSSPREFVKRAAFALVASLSAHDRISPDERFLACLPLIEEGARDGRNLVKKAVSWALRQIGKRNLPLHPAAVAAAKRLASSDETPRRWVGQDALRELMSPGVRERLVSRAENESGRIPPVRP